MKKAERLHYDMNTSTFYRVTNDTGEMKRSYVNGSEIPFFKPGITGISYMERKSFEEGSKPSEKKTHKRGVSYNYKTLDVKPTHKQKPSLFEKITSASKLGKDFKAYRNAQATFYDRQTSPREERWESFQREDKFRNTSRKFEELNESKIEENHSPKKQLQGSVPKHKLSDEMCMTLTKLPNIDEDKFYKEDKKKQRKKRSIKQQKLPKQCEQLSQIRKQRNILYRFRPDFVYREKQRSLEKQKQRRINMIKLQKLAISVMNKQTSDPIMG